MIVTASWSTPLPEGHLRLGISRGVPRRGLQPGFRLYRKLAPGPWFHDVMTPDEWTARYRDEVLSRLDPEQVRDDLLGLAEGRVPVLVCFERAGGPSWCHRALAAAWLAAGLGQPVPELGFEDLPQDRHPMRPPELLV